MTAQAGQFNNQFPSLAAAGGYGYGGGTAADNLYSLNTRGSQAPAQVGSSDELPVINGDWMSSAPTDLYSGGDYETGDMEYF
jgi:hypothetical protein